MSRTDTPGNESVAATYPADPDRAEVFDTDQRDQVPAERETTQDSQPERVEAVDRVEPTDSYESGDRAETDEQGFAPAPPTESAVPEQRAEPVAVGAASAGQHSSGAEDQLLDATVAGRFHERWRDVQAGFVDDPAQAVRSAGELLDEVSSELGSAVSRRRAAITTAEGSDADDETEHLRRSLQSYRRLVNRLLAM